MAKCLTIAKPPSHHHGNGHAADTPIRTSSSMRTSDSVATKEAAVVSDMASVSVLSEMAKCIMPLCCNCGGQQLHAHYISIDYIYR